MSAHHRTASSLSRRSFLQTTATATAGFAMTGPAFAQKSQSDTKGKSGAKGGSGSKGAWFKISLAEWSLHRTIFGGKMTNLDFPVVARKEFGIEAVEYVNQFFKDKAQDASYLAELNKRCDGEGVRSLLIMCDGEGRLGDPDEKKRAEAVENHRKWLDAAKTLGCHSIRVNASSDGGFEEQQKLAADGLSRLGELGEKVGINVLVENHGGLSSNGKWLAGVMKLVGKPSVGTLPDFGNFLVGGWDKPKEEQDWYDRYQGVKELMPFAKAVSAKSHQFDGSGVEVRTDYSRMMQIVHAAGFRGYVGIEWEGDEPGEHEGIRLTKQLLERVRGEAAVAG